MAKAWDGDRTTGRQADSRIMLRYFMVRSRPHGWSECSQQFQIKDEIKAARTEATKAYNLYVEEPKTSQRK
jgi:hypothetical protein